MPEDCNPLIKKASQQKWSLWSFEKGLATLVEALEKSLLESGVNVLKNTSLVSIEENEKNKIELKGSFEGQLEVADHVFSSIPAKQLAALLPKKHDDVSSLLQKIAAVAVAVVNLEFDGPVLDIKGFGYLYPSRESPKVLGVIFDSCTFTGGDRKSSVSTRLTVMLGGHLFEESFGDPDKVNKDLIEKEALRALHDALGIKGVPSKVLISVHKDCIPQYHVGHSGILKSLRQYTAQRSFPLTFIGSWYDGVGINDCVYTSQAAVDELLHK